MKYRRARLRCSPDRAISLAALAAAVLLVMLPGAALARQGPYVGLGVGSQQFSGGFPGDATLADSPTAPQNEVRLGRPDAGTGLAFNGGYGLTDHVALDLQLLITDHDTTFTAAAGANEPYEATLSTVVFGVRVGVPLGEIAEVFGRFGLGGYELVYDANNIGLADGMVDGGARLSGRGFAFGVGAELFFGRWGLQLAYTAHDVEFDAVESANVAASIAPALSTTVSGIVLVFNYYLQ